MAGSVATTIVARALQASFGKLVAAIRLRALAALFLADQRRSGTCAPRGEGLVHGKRCAVLLASGGVYTEGSPIQDRDIATMYLRLVLKAPPGIEDVTFVAAGGSKVVDLGERSRADLLQTFEPAVVSAAQA
jgi:FMN-dependent NADH-azoreductase